MNFEKLEEKAIQHIDRVIGDKELMNYFHKVTSEPIRLYVTSMLNEFHTHLKTEIEKQLKQC